MLHVNSGLRSCLPSLGDCSLGARDLQPQVGAGPTAPVQLPGRPAMLQLPAGSGSEPGVGTALAVLGGGAALVLLLRAWK